MREFYSGLATWLSSQYNTDAGTAALTVGKNLFVGRMPAQPNFAVGILPADTPRDPHSVMRRPEFDLVVRAPQEQDALAATACQSLYGYMDFVSSPVNGYPGFIRPVQEPAAGGEDQQRRIVLVTKFVLWSIRF